MPLDLGIWWNSESIKAFTLIELALLIKDLLNSLLNVIIELFDKFLLDLTLIDFLLYEGESPIDDRLV